MTETEKIKCLIEKYKTLFETTDMDICQSMKGYWYFSRYNKEYNYYDCFTRFETAKELAEIMLGELGIDMFIAIDEEPEAVQYPYGNVAEDVQLEIDYKDNIEKLMDYLGYSKNNQ